MSEKLGTQQPTNVDQQDVTQPTDNTQQNVDGAQDEQTENKDNYIRDFDPVISFHNESLGTTVNVTIDDQSLKRMSTGDTALLHLDYTEEDIDNKNIITYPSKTQIMDVIGDIGKDDGRFKRPKIVSPTNKDKDWRGKLIATPFDDFGNGIEHIKTVWTIWSSLGTKVIEITKEIAELNRRPLNEAFISTGEFKGEHVNIRVDYFGSDGTRLAGIPVRVLVFPITVGTDETPDIKYYSDKEQMSLEVNFNPDTMFSCNIEEATHNRTIFSFIKSNSSVFIHQMLEAQGVGNIIDYHPLLKEGTDEYDNLNPSFTARPLDRHGITFTGFGELEADTDYYIIVKLSTIIENEEIWGAERIFTYNVSRGVIVPIPKITFPTNETREVDYYGCLRCDPLKIINNSIHLGTIFQMALDEEFRQVVFTKMGSRFGERQILNGDFTSYNGNLLAKRYKEKLQKNFAEACFLYPLEFENFTNKVVYIRAKSILTNFTADRSNKDLVTTLAQKAETENITHAEFLELEPIESDWSMPIVFSLEPVKAHIPKLILKSNTGEIYEKSVIKSCARQNTDSKYSFTLETDGWYYEDEELNKIDQLPTYPLTDFKAKLVIVRSPLRWREYHKRKNNQELDEWFLEQKYVSPVEPNLFSFLTSTDQFVFNGTHTYDVEAEYLKTSNLEFLIKSSYTGVRAYLLLTFTRMYKELKTVVLELTFVSQEYVKDNLTLLPVPLPNQGRGSNKDRYALTNKGTLPTFDEIKNISPLARVKTNLLGEEQRLEELAKRPGAIPIEHGATHWELIAVPRGTTDLTRGTVMWDLRSRFNKFVLGGTIDQLWEQELFPDLDQGAPTTNVATSPNNRSS